ncbi:MAG: hypothetical protein ABI925_04965 [Verrucomicrobiota bacterium]
MGRVQAAQQISEDRELKEIDLSGWNCVTRPEGTSRSPDTSERNRLKSRSPIDLAGVKVPSFDTAGFLRHVGPWDAQSNGKRRKEVSPQDKQKLEPMEKQIVSLTGYMGLAYPGPPESTNCSSVDFHDWHMEIFEKPPDHPPQPGDPTPIICEITPRTQNAVYRDGIRIQQLTAFFRRSDVTYESTGHKAAKVRITGYLLWDDEHNSAKDVGTTIQTLGRSKYHNPWRSTAWEIHPVLKIEKLDGSSPQIQNSPPPATPEGSPSPDKTSTPPVVPAEATPVATSPPPTPTPVPTPTPQRYVTILRQVKIKIPYGETILQRGMRLPVISHDAQTVTVDYMGKKQVIPIASTDLR